ncbi:hypothetical protein AgCh_031423 [Apium graveolens]
MLLPDLDEDEDEDNRSFSPDLKLFIGKLPFNCDSAVLADLFGNAGTVEMVEDLDGRQIRVSVAEAPPQRRY